MSYLSGKHILLGVTGGIAAYKSAELVRRLREQGAGVRVVMTASAMEFITPLTLQALSGHPVATRLLDPEAEAAMGHIELARWADAVLVAPATANFLARRLHGRGDDLLTALCLAADVPEAVAPAMNRGMWNDPAMQENIATLKARGIHVFGPAEGAQACGETGPGRMLEVDAITGLLGELFATGSLAGLRVLVSAGPTREPLDPVRFLSNRSSGKMGFAVAAAAAEAGADVTLVAGPVALPTPGRVRRVDVVTAADMFAAVAGRAGEADIFIAAAAVADYRPQVVARQKLKKASGRLVLELERNPDILATVAGGEHAPFCVGFAAETDHVEHHARQKLQAKSLDMIAANRVGDDLGFDSDENALQVYWEGGSVELGRGRKTALARQLIEVVAGRYHARFADDKVVNLHAKDPA